MFKLPKNDHKYRWTNHVVDKMRYYGISESLIKRIVRFPKRKEEGIAPETVAAMSPYGRSPKGRHSYRGEVWVMYQTKNQKSKIKNQNHNSKFKIEENQKIIISAWRYPGVSPTGKAIPIPEEILHELNDLLD